MGEPGCSPRVLSAHDALCSWAAVLMAVRVTMLGSANVRMHRIIQQWSVADDRLRQGSMSSMAMLRQLVRSFLHSGATCFFHSFALNGLSNPSGATNSSCADGLRRFPTVNTRSFGVLLALRSTITDYLRHLSDRLCIESPPPDTDWGFLQAAVPSATILRDSVPAERSSVT